MSRGRSGSTFTSEVSATRICSENVPSWAKRAASVSPMRCEVEPSARVIIWRSNSLAPSSQRFWWPVEHDRHRPQAGMKDMDTWSPGARVVTPGPTCRTIPEPSWPPTKGKWGTGRSPVTTCSSEWHIPANAVSTSTSPGPGSSRVMSSTFQSCCGSQSTAVRVVVGIGFPFVSAAPARGRPLFYRTGCGRVRPTRTARAAQAARAALRSASLASSGTAARGSESSATVGPIRSASGARASRSNP